MTQNGVLITEFSTFPRFVIERSHCIFIIYKFFRPCLCMVTGCVCGLRVVAYMAVLSGLGVVTYMAVLSGLGVVTYMAVLSGIGVVAYMAVLSGLLI